MRNCIFFLLVFIVSVLGGGKYGLRSLKTAILRYSNKWHDRRLTSNQSLWSRQQLVELRCGNDDLGAAPTGEDGSTKVNSKKETFGMDVIYFAAKHALSNILKDPDALRIVSRILSTVAWAYIVLSAVGTLGFDTKPLLSLLGIGGLTVGFSAKDMLADSFAGLFVLFTRPFQRGDVVTINGSKGRVVSMDMRYVRLYNAEEGAEVLIPVSTVYKSEIKIERPIV